MKAIAKEQRFQPTPPKIRVSFTNAAGDQCLEFVRSFEIGRADNADVCILDQHVSRKHVRVAFEDGQWWINDLQSSNGVFVAGERLQRAPLMGTVNARLGIEGPILSFCVEKKATPALEIGSETMVDRYVKHYLTGEGNGAPPGEHTMMVRKAFARLQTKEKFKYITIVTVLAVAVLTAAAVAIHQGVEAAKQKSLAQDIFYNMKALDLDLVNLERAVVNSNNVSAATEIRKYRGRRKALETSYDQLLANLHVYDPKMTAQQQLVLRIARIFGECELATPPSFMDEINNYIKKWQSSGRLSRAISLAKSKGYMVRISEELLAQGLPPQFFYLALQESDFDPFVSGPMTAKGIAKGMWQFIPETAVNYGLKLGPLFDLRRPDPGDDRHHWEIETKAAARYLKDLYGTDAQASGLLVMSCYNWGENRVLPLIRSLPANPKDRNFWKLLSSHRDRIPRETYDYVFSIASAAVIGENPRLFGFDFDNPLAHLEKK